MKFLVILLGLLFAYCSAASVTLLARKQDPVAAQLVTAADAHAEAAHAIKEAANALKDTALSLKTTVNKVAKASEEEHELKQAVRKHIDQSNEEIQRLEQSLVPSKTLRKMVEAQGPPKTPRPQAAPVALPPPSTATLPVLVLPPAPAAPQGLSAPARAA